MQFPFITYDVALYNASQKKGNQYINFLLLKTVMIYQKKFTLLQNSVYPLSFDTSYKAQTISNGDVIIDLRRIWI